MDHHAKIKIAILHSLKRMPKTYTQRDEVLRAEVCLDVQPRPHAAGNRRRPYGFGTILLHHWHSQ